MSYKPYRVLRRVIVVITNSDDVISCYPHGKTGRPMRATGKIPIIFSPGVIDAPTDDEIALFDLPALSESVRLIPQDRRGFDDRLSGVARSFKGSQRGREAAVIESHERDSNLKFKAKAKAETEAEAEKNDDAATILQPVQDNASEHAGPLIDDLEYLNPMAKKSLSEKGITNIGQLHGWTAEKLNGLPGIGTKLAEKLLSDYAAEPVIDETRKVIIDE